jgi:hypothetical protein
MSLIAMLGWAELVILAVVIAIGIGCWLVFSRSSNEKKDE